MQRLLSRLFFLASSLLLIVVQGQEDDGDGAIAHDHTNDHVFLTEQFVFTKRQDLTLPKPLSDFTATKDETTGLVYIAGGCDAETGNQYSEEIKEFICATTSNKLYAFDHKASSFRQLADMPVQRYRHGAALVNGHLWLFGGRDAEMDALLPTLDVYSIEEDTWQSFDISALDESQLRSDNGGFADPNTGLAYFVGGYDPIYGFLGSVFAVDTATTLQTGTVTTVPKAPLLLARGDLTAIVSSGGTKAIVTGGFGTEEEFCNPMLDVEEYDFATDTWTAIGKLNNGRGDKALVSFQNHFFALGGERQINGICELSDPPAVGEKTIAVDDIEVYHPETDQWETLVEDLPNHRFRFAAVGYDDAETNAIYAFGGQEAFDESCMCFRTTDSIYTFAQAEAPLQSDNNDDPSNASPSSSSSSGSAAASSLSTNTPLLLLTLFLPVAL